MSLKVIKQFPTKPTFLRTPDKDAFIYCHAFTNDNNSEHYTNWRKHRYGPDSPHDYRMCRRIAVVEVDDVYLCSAHAGKLALLKWVKGDLVEAPILLPTETTEE